MNHQVDIFQDRASRLHRYVKQKQRTRTSISPVNHSELNRTECNYTVATTTIGTFLLFIVIWFGFFIPDLTSDHNTMHWAAFCLRISSSFGALELFLSLSVRFVIAKWEGKSYVSKYWVKNFDFSYSYICFQLKS